MSEVSYAITTIDNPLNPFTQFDEWSKFDHFYGYNSIERVLRLCNFDSQMSELEKDQEYERAIDRLIEIDITGLYTKVQGEGV